MKEIKWSQWTPESGMIRCGTAEYSKITKWLGELGLDAQAHVNKAEKPHAIYGRKMHDNEGRLTEIRLYCDTYLTDEELDTVATLNPMDILLVAHKR